MRISDWSSDVCSSDLVNPPGSQLVVDEPKPRKPRRWPWVAAVALALLLGVGIGSTDDTATTAPPDKAIEPKVRTVRTKERRVGTKCVSQCRPPSQPAHDQNNNKHINNSQHTHT